MSKQPRVAVNPDTLKPIIEAMIFASEEPLSARALLRLLSGEGENGRADDPAPAGSDEPEGAAQEAVEPAITEPEAAEPEITESAPEEPVAGGPVTTTTETEPSEAGEPDTEEDAEPETGADETGTDAPPGEHVPHIEMIGDAVESPAPESVQDAGTHDPTVVVGGTIEIAGEAATENAEPAAEAGVPDEDANDLANAMNCASRRRGDDGPPVLDQVYLRMLVDELNEEYETSGRVFRIVEVAGGFQFATIREFGEFVAMLSKDKARRRLSPAALETLAIIAYRQPVSKPEVEAIRGVNCDQVLLSLMEKNLVAITGRSEAVGRPLLYGTTEDFLRIFGLKGLGDLPKLREIEELMEEDAFSAEKADVITVDEDTDVEEIEAKVGAAGHHGEHSEDGLPPESRAVQDPEQVTDDAAAPGEEDGGDENEGIAAEGQDKTEDEGDEEMDDMSDEDQEEMEDEIEDDGGGDDEEQEDKIEDDDEDQEDEMEDDDDEEQEDELEDESDDDEEMDAADEEDDEEEHQEDVMDEQSAGNKPDAGEDQADFIQNAEENSEDSEMVHNARMA